MQYEFREDALEQQGLDCPNLPSRAGISPEDLPGDPTQEDLCAIAANTIAALRAEGKTPSQATLDTAAECGLAP